MQEFKMKVMDRRETVKRLEQLLGIRAKFMRGQNFSYQIGAYTVTRDGVLLAPDEAFEDVLQTLVNENFIERVEEVTATAEETTPEEPEETVTESDTMEPETTESTDNIEAVITLPLTDHNGPIAAKSCASPLHKGESDRESDGSVFLCSGKSDRSAEGRCLHLFGRKFSQNGFGKQRRTSRRYVHRGRYSHYCISGEYGRRSPDSLSESHHANEPFSHRA